MTDDEIISMIPDGGRVLELEAKKTGVLVPTFILFLLRGAKFEESGFMESDP